MHVQTKQADLIIFLFDSDFIITFKYFNLIE